MFETEAERAMTEEEWLAFRNPVRQAYEQTRLAPVRKAWCWYAPLWRLSQRGEADTFWLEVALRDADSGNPPPFSFGGLHRLTLRWEMRAQEMDRLLWAPVVACVFGNPFRPTVIRPDWLAWNDGTVRKIADTIYDDQAFGELPLLADALEDAGCDNAAMLGHLRGPGPHVRGCWVIDALVGDELSLLRRAPLRFDRYLARRARG